MEKLLRITFLVTVAFLTTSVLQSQTLTVTSTPAEVDENGESVAGPTTFKMEVRDWPIGSQIYARIKTGTNPDGPNPTDWKKLQPDPFVINSTTTTNAGALVTASAVTIGNMVTFDGQTKQGYNVDLEWSQWNNNGTAIPMSGDDLILGGAGFFNNAFGTDKIVILGASTMTYTPSGAIVDAVSFNFTGPIPQNTAVDIPIIYTSEDPIAIGGVKFDIASDTEPFTTTFIGTYSNTEILPAGTNMTATIEMSNFAAIYTVENVDGGVLLATEPTNELLIRNPNGATNPTNAFYRLTGIAGDDPNFTGVLGQGFRGIEVNPTLGTSDIGTVGINAFYKSTTQSIELSSDTNIDTVNVYGISGKMVFSTNVNDANKSIDVSNLSSGLYIAIITNESGSTALKMVK